MRLISRVFFVSALSLLTSSLAYGQAFVSPFIGVTGGGDATRTSPAVGVTAGWLAKGWLGFEGDLGTTPAFFEQDGFLTSRRVTTLMGNAIVAVPFGRRDGFRPYVSGGAGLVRPNLSEAGGFAVVDANTLGVNVGAGVMTFNKNGVGLRGDVRYFRGVRESDADNNAFGIDFSKFNFWRASVGLAVRF